MQADRKQEHYTFTLAIHLFYRLAVSIANQQSRSIRRLITGKDMDIKTRLDNLHCPFVNTRSLNAVNLNSPIFLIALGAP